MLADDACYRGGKGAFACICGWAPDNLIRFFHTRLIRLYLNPAGRYIEVIMAEGVPEWIAVLVIQHVQAPALLANLFYAFIYIRLGQTP